MSEQMNLEQIVNMLALTVKGLSDKVDEALAKNNPVLSSSSSLPKYNGDFDITNVKTYTEAYLNGLPFYRTVNNKRIPVDGTGLDLRNAALVAGVKANGTKGQVVARILKAINAPTVENVKTEKTKKFPAPPKKYFPEKIRVFDVDRLSQIARELMAHQKQVHEFTTSSEVAEIARSVIGSLPPGSAGYIINEKLTEAIGEVYCGCVYGHNTFCSYARHLKPSAFKSKSTGKWYVTNKRSMVQGKPENQDLPEPLPNIWGNSAAKSDKPMVGGFSLKLD